MDFITGLPKINRVGRVYDAILVIVDRFTKMALYIPCTKELKAHELADIFFEQVVRRFGTPAGIVSDRGTIFTGDYWSEVCACSKITRNLSNAFYPQTDGQTERQNWTLEHYLQAYCEEQQGRWLSLLPTAEFAYNKLQAFCSRS